MANSLDRRAGLGNALAVKDAPTDSTYVDLTLADEISYSGGSTAEVDISGLADIVARKAAGRRDPGNMTFSMFYLTQDPDVIKVLGIWASRKTVSWQHTLADSLGTTKGSTDTFDGFISNVTPGGFAADGTPKMTVTVTISGDKVNAAGTTTP